MRASVADTVTWWEAGEWHRLAPALEAAARSVGLLRVVPADDADDLVQRTIIKCWTIGYTPADPLAFAARVCVNLCKDYLKSKVVRDATATAGVDVDAFEGDASLVLDTLIQRENVGRLRRALTRLPDPMRRCIALHDLHQYPCAQVADLLDLTEGAVKMRLYRARRLLGHLYAITPPPRVKANGVPERTRGRAPRPLSWREIA